MLSMAALPNNQLNLGLYEEDGFGKKKSSCWVIMESCDDQDQDEDEDDDHDVIGTYNHPTTSSSSSSSLENSVTSNESLSPSSSSSSDLIDDDGDDDVSSSPSSSKAIGPLYELSELMAQLPIKRGLSKYFQGKSQSFSSLSKATSIEDLAKKENPFNARRRIMKACKSYGGGLVDAHKSSYTSLPKPTISKKKKASSSRSFSTGRSTIIF